MHGPCISTSSCTCIYQPELALTAVLVLNINAIQNGNGDYTAQDGEIAVGFIFSLHMLKVNFMLRNSSVISIHKSCM